MLIKKCCWNSTEKRCEKRCDILRKHLEQRQTAKIVAAKRWPYSWRLSAWDLEVNNQQVNLENRRPSCQGALRPAYLQSSAAIFAASLPSLPAVQRSFARSDGSWTVNPRAARWVAPREATLDDAWKDMKRTNKMVLPNAKGEGKAEGRCLCWSGNIYESLWISLNPVVSANPLWQSSIPHEWQKLLRSSTSCDCTGPRSPPVEKTA